MAARTRVCMGLLAKHSSTQYITPHLAGPAKGRLSRSPFSLFLSLFYIYFIFYFFWKRTDWTVLWLVEEDDRYASAWAILTAGKATFVQAGDVTFAHVDDVLETTLRLARTAIVVASRPSLLVAQLAASRIYVFKPSVVAAYLLLVRLDMTNDHGIGI